MQYFIIYQAKRGLSFISLSFRPFICGSVYIVTTDKRLDRLFSFLCECSFIILGQAMYVRAFFSIFHPLQTKNELFPISLLQSPHPERNLLCSKVYCKSTVLSVESLCTVFFIGRGRNSYHIHQHRTTAFEHLPPEVGVRIITKKVPNVSRFG